MEYTINRYPTTNIMKSMQMNLLQFHCHAPVRIDSFPSAVIRIMLQDLSDWVRSQAHHLCPEPASHGV